MNHRRVTALFALTLFTSASLIFIVEPMFGKMVLPRLGGTPAVWNTCMVFYRAVLLAGYLYAHLLSSRFRLSLQIILHCLVLLLGMFALPVSMPPQWTPPVDRSPIPSLLGALITGVGVPLFVLSATAPLLQKWFSVTDTRSASDPYFLYAASNLGSILALLAYPFVIEPSSTLQTQASMWTVAYVALIVLSAACGLLALRLGRATPTTRPDESEPAASSVSWQRRGRWFALALVPSSLMLAATTYLSTDVGSVPLLWTIPLALYLLSFILGFASTRLVPRSLTQPAASTALVVLAFVFALGINRPLVVPLAVHLTVLFLVALALHSDLADDRPSAAHLTEFYLWIAAGGVAGGLFNALAAPLLFTSVFEYPLALAVAASLIRLNNGPALPDWRNLTSVLTAGAGAFCFVYFLGNADFHPLIAAAVLAVTIVALIMSARSPVSFGLAIALVLASGWPKQQHGELIYARRTFFGVVRVWNVPSEQQHRIMHGTTFHGVQSTVAALRQEPLSYYHPEGPIGQVFTARKTQLSRAKVGVVGLGAGSLATYAQPDQHWTFYEIDPEVARIANDPRLFTFLRDCGARCAVRLGDARLALERERIRYDVLVIDAFSSDAIPVHLMTREAMHLYLDRLADDGILVFHISNRNLKLRSMVASLASDQRLATRGQFYRKGTEDLIRTSSQWVAMAHSAEHLGTVATDKRWSLLRPEPGTRIWSDDYSDILSVLQL